MSREVCWSPIMEFDPTLLLGTAEGIVACCFPANAWTIRSRMSQTCSIQYKSGDMAGQSILFALLTRRKSSTIRARWCLALSSWNIGSGTGIWRRNGSTWGVRTSSMYRWPCKFPSMNTRTVLRGSSKNNWSVGYYFFIYWRTYLIFAAIADQYLRKRLRTTWRYAWRHNSVMSFIAT